jgi:phage-related protein
MTDRPALRPLIWVGSSREDFRGDAFRAVYTVRFAGTVYVLHAFQKKSKRGRATLGSTLI